MSYSNNKFTNCKTDHLTTAAAHIHADAYATADILYLLKLSNNLNICRTWDGDWK